ncbi:50S ribosomal protein L6 [Haloferula sp. A504]|jgi:large subunit ribosomal protein L6|uniref:50S ribosomal protein L6 n=1 Tax=Haloferula sp. A504 TaxID=3373601 RepID=UPI0031BD0247|nr:50S ribosomal protein L6 [Verrucomicrobiaceae bacterium E54]
MSRVGLKPIALPDKVKLNISNGSVAVEGPKGKLDLDLPKGVSVAEEDGQVVVSRASELREHRALHGTVRSLINNMITGVTDGFVKELEIQGVGMRAAVKGQALDLALGKSHPILHPIPSELTVSVADNTKIKVEGIDKQMVGQFAAEVRSFYPPEPYKGKGVRYAGERVRRKEGKSVAK